MQNAGVMPRQTNPIPEDELTNNVQPYRLGLNYEGRPWSLKKLSRLSGIDDSHLSRIEQGKRELTAEARMKLAHAFRCHPLDLLLEEDRQREERLYGNTVSTQRLETIIELLRGMEKDGSFELPSKLFAQAVAFCYEFISREDVHEDLDSYQQAMQVYLQNNIDFRQLKKKKVTV